MATIEDYLLSLSPPCPTKRINFRSTRVEIPYYLWALVDAHLSDSQLIKARHAACYMQQKAKTRVFGKDAMEVALLAMTFSAHMKKVKMTSDVMDSFHICPRYSTKKLKLNEAILRATVISTGIEQKYASKRVTQIRILHSFIERTENALRKDALSAHRRLTDELHLHCLKKRLTLYLLDKKYHKTAIPDM